MAVLSLQSSSALAGSDMCPAWLTRLLWHGWLWLCSAKLADEDVYQGVLMRGVHLLVRHPLHDEVRLKQL